MAKSITIKILGITVLQWIDDNGDNLVEALRELVEAEDLPPEGSITLSPRSDYEFVDPDGGRLILQHEEPEEEFEEFEPTLAEEPEDEG